MGQYISCTGKKTIKESPTKPYMKHVPSENVLEWWKSEEGRITPEFGTILPNVQHLYLAGHTVKCKTNS